MNYKMMGRFIGQIIILEAVFLLPALAISLWYRENSSVQGFLYTLGILLAVGLPLHISCRKAGRLFGAQEGLVCVSLSWMILSLLGALPFWISCQIPHYIDALFEARPFLPTWRA